MKSLFALITLLISISSFAAPTLKCESDSGRTVLNATLPGYYADHTIRFTIDGETLPWYSQMYDREFDTNENSRVYILGSLKDKNYHFIVISSKGYRALTFTAIPSTIKLKETQNTVKATFKAVAFGIDPREGYSLSPDITLNCDYSYKNEFE